MGKNHNGLTPKQERFCKEYVASGHGTRAAILAGYSPRTAQVIGSENLKKPIIECYIAELQALIPDTLKEKIATRDECLEALTEVVRFPLPEKVAAKERVLAVDGISKLAGYYPVDKQAVRDINVVFIIGKGYRETVGERTGTLIEGVKED